MSFYCVCLFGSALVMGTRAKNVEGIRRTGAQGIANSHSERAIDSQALLQTNVTIARTSTVAQGRKVFANVSLVSPNQSEFWFLDHYVRSADPGHAMVAKTQKLGFCAISKVASSGFRNLFTLLGAEAFERPPDFPPFVTQENGYSLITFFRDPVDRFLSTWIHGCVAEEWADMEGYVEYPPCLHANGSEPWLMKSSEMQVEAFKRAVREALPAYMDFYRRDLVRSMFDPQSDHCGGSFLESYKAFGNLSRSADYVNGQVTNMLMLGGLNSSEAASLASIYFPSDDGATYNNTQDYDKDAYLEDQEVVELIKAAFADDYILIRQGQAMQLSPRTA